MSVFFVVAFVAWQCPGGWFSGLVPDKLRPIMCEARYDFETKADLAEAKALVAEKGRGATLSRCRSQEGEPDCDDIEVTWVSEPRFSDPGE